MPFALSFDESAEYDAGLPGITLQIKLQLAEKTVACFAEDENFNRNVLGRHGFLDRTVLGLVDYEGKLYLNQYGEL